MASFPLFTSFPAEIQALVMTQCPPNELICLRLTCKTLYKLSPLKLRHRLDNSDRSYTCCDESPSNGPTVGCSWSVSRWTHRRTCHNLTYTHHKTQAEIHNLPIPAERPCRTARWHEHCECFDRRSKLHARLRSWMPSNLHYCGDCRLFTKRKRGHNGRCYHGRPKPRRRYEGHNWTHRSRNGAFGRKLWKKWFNNAAMDTLEKRLRDPGERKVNERYRLRELRGREVDSWVSRKGVFVVDEMGRDVSNTIREGYS